MKRILVISLLLISFSAVGERFYDETGKYVGRLDESGKYYDAENKYLGSVTTKGRIYDDANQYKGKVDNSKGRPLTNPYIIWSW